MDKVVHSPAYCIGTEGLPYTNLPVSPTLPVREVVDLPNHNDSEETEIMNLFMTQNPNKIMIASCLETDTTHATQTEPNSRDSLGIRQILTRSNLPLWTGQPKLKVLEKFELKEVAYNELHDLTSTLENMVLRLFYNLKLIRI